MSLPGIEGPLIPLRPSRKPGTGANRAPDLQTLHLRHHPESNRLIFREQIIDTQHGIQVGFRLNPNPGGQVFTLPELFPFREDLDIEALSALDLSTLALEAKLGLHWEKMRRQREPWFDEPRPDLCIPRGVWGAKYKGADSIVMRSYWEDFVIVMERNTNIEEGAECASGVFSTLSEILKLERVAIQAAVICICDPSAQHQDYAFAASPLVLHLHLRNLYKANIEADVPAAVRRAIQNTIR